LRGKAVRHRGGIRDRCRSAFGRCRLRLRGAPSAAAEIPFNQASVKDIKMKQRLQFFAKAPEIMKAVSALNKAVDECGLEVTLLHLIKLRASQINGCSFCVEMHSREARRDGETETRLYLVSAWKESPLFS